MRSRKSEVKNNNAKKIKGKGIEKEGRGKKGGKMGECGRPRQEDGL